MQSALTLHLATALGFYFLAVGLGGFSRRRWIAILADLTAHPGLSYLCGFVCYLSGLIIIMIHNYWGSFLEGFVSLVAWMAAIEGLIFLMMPGTVLRLSARVVERGITPYFAGLTALAGAALIITGYSGLHAS